MIKLQLYCSARPQSRARIETSGGGGIIWSTNRSARPQSRARIETEISAFNFDFWSVAPGPKAGRGLKQF